MALWRTESAAGGVVIAIYENPPMNYFCALGTQELPGKLITHYSVEELLGLARDPATMRALGRGLTASACPRRPSASRPRALASPCARSSARLR